MKRDANSELNDTNSANGKSNHHTGKICVFFGIANSFSATVSVIDTATNQVIESVPVAASPWDLAVGPDGTLYVACSGASQVVVLTADQLGG